MPSFFKSVPVAFALIPLSVGMAYASDASDIARVDKLPVPVVETVLQNVDAYFASPSAPSNRMVSGILKDLSLKAIQNRLSGLDDAAPGKASEAKFEDKNATYHAAVRTSRHDTTETSDCVENKVVLTSSEGLPIVKDGAFNFDMVHPRVTTWGWTLTFCRTATGNGEFSDWQMSSPAK